MPLVGVVGWCFGAWLSYLLLLLLLLAVTCDMYGISRIFLRAGAPGCLGRLCGLSVLGLGSDCDAAELVQL